MVNELRSSRMLSRFSFVTVSLLATAVILPAAVSAQGRTLVAIVNRDRPESSLSRRELIQIFRGEVRYWAANRELIQLALPPGSTEAKNEFIRKVLQMTPSDWDREWRGKQFRGES